MISPFIEFITSPRVSLPLFTEWFLSSPYAAKPVPQVGAIEFLDKGIVGLTLFRVEPFQVQLFIVPPGVTLPPHTHPNVEVSEVYVTGEFFAQKNGTPVVYERHMVPDEDGNCQIAWKTIDLDAGEPHSAQIGNRGCAFLSIQKWINGVKPKSITLDWGGAPLGDKHDQALLSQDITHAEKSLIK